MRSLGVIPARGGSKGVPRKNLRLVADQPLIAHAIATARDSRRLDDFVVTTDDAEIAEVAEALGSRVILRPSDLASDEAPMGPVLRHAVLNAEASSALTYDAVVLLQPPSPIRTGADIDEVITILEHHPDVDTVISVSQVEDAHPARMYRIGDGGELEPLWPEWEHARRQDLPPLFHRTGALYGVRRDVVVDECGVIGRRCRPYVMPAAWVANIDDERDLVIADVLLRQWKALRARSDDDG